MTTKLYHTFGKEILEASPENRHRWYHLLDKVNPPSLVNIANSENLQDPRREMARRIIMEMYLEINEPSIQ